MKSVIGRAEDKELPMFESGAFDIEVPDTSRNGEKLVNRQLLNRCLPRGEILRHTMRDLIDSIRLVSTSEFQCSEWAE
ncbi:hypothetical protein, partial [Klebsiella pneumoniae]|uniref:hypothetical protein n=1 Tax=Klebsiella pneumoniae TaxID=573 RepID=UPI0030135890